MARAGLEPQADLAALAQSLARVLDATGAERDAAIAAVTQAREHPLLVAAREAAECFRETPFVYRDPDGRLVEGVPDLVFRADSGAAWTLVDFKTDLRLDMSPDAYRRQVALYVRALEDATGSPARGILLYV